MDVNISKRDEHKKTAFGTPLSASVSAAFKVFRRTSQLGGKHCLGVRLGVSASRHKLDRPLANFEVSQTVGYLSTPRSRVGSAVTVCLLLYKAV